MRFFVLIAAIALATACSGSTGNSTPNVATGTPKPASTPLPVSSYEVVKVYPHDDKAFTQGLFFHDGFLYESTGQYGKSSLRKVEITTGKVLQKWDLPREDFGEGSTLLGDKIYMVTWQQGLGRVFNLSDFKLIREFQYQGEGWGLTNDGTSLIMSQGTHVLKFIDPNTFVSNKTLPIMREDGRPLMQINELEYVKGEIWANIWHSEDPKVLGKPNYIARIDPATGKIVGWIDLANISPEDQRRDSENTLNGIAYDAANDRIFVTGKNWKRLYEIKLKPAQ
ncbi:MAG: glutaminyl-peptide cyclotransferase [Blastocatellia bacterium]|nr:glutaminyl-peptide cyclotransferase [Blastocatellia bacterium]